MGKSYRCQKTFWVLAALAINRGLLTQDKAMGVWDSPRRRHLSWCEHLSKLRELIARAEEKRRIFDEQTAQMF